MILARPALKRFTGWILGGRWSSKKISRSGQVPYFGEPGGMPISKPSARINSIELSAPKPTRAKQTPRRPPSLGGRTNSGSRPKTRLTCSRARCCSSPTAPGLNSSTLRVMISKDSKKCHPFGWSGQSRNHTPLAAKRPQSSSQTLNKARLVFTRV